MSELISVHTTESRIQELDEFTAKYDIERVISCPEVPNKVWKPRSKRICRFCNKKFPETNFKNDAHHIPEFLGNKYLIFQDECDTCNSHFSKYESHLSSYLAMTNTLIGQKGKKNKVPKYKSNDGLVGEQQEYYGINGIIIEKGGEQIIELDMRTGKSKLEFTIPTYIPIKAYKALLKIAATSLFESDMQYYKILLKALASDLYDEQLSKMAIIKEYWFPFKYNSPVVFLFRSKSTESNLPTHICMIYFGYQAFQYVVPAYSLDKYMTSGETITPIYCPAIHILPINGYSIKERFLNFGRRDKIVGEKAVFHFECDPEQLKNLTSYDPRTNKTTKSKLDPNGIVKMIIGKNGDILDLPTE